MTNVQTRPLADHHSAHSALLRFCRDYIALQHGWQAKLVSQGMQRAGLPDLLCCLPGPCGAGHMVGVEVKTGSARLTVSQQREREAIERAGGLYVVVRTPEGLEAALLEAGLVSTALLRARGKVPG